MKKNCMSCSQEDILAIVLIVIFVVLTLIVLGVFLVRRLRKSSKVAEERNLVDREKVTSSSNSIGNTLNNSGIDTQQDNFS